ncbi:uncharacterized protein LOC119880885 [Canis lupus familiaris]|uniref:uncharacterized protein LOC119880885 n=1 Tax=Canis lupus familiaris TaxID=9615 RepID=UPI0018F52D0F|nr:uncharacterized protein LOC119880885 [Canis lupus familiaris]
MVCSGAAQEGALEFRTTSGVLDFYFLKGLVLSLLIRKLRLDLLGHARLPLGPSRGGQSWNKSNTVFTLLVSPLGSRAAPESDTERASERPGAPLPPPITPLAEDPAPFGAFGPPREGCSAAGTCRPGAQPHHIPHLSSWGGRSTKGRSPRLAGTQNLSKQVQDDEGQERMVPWERNTPREHHTELGLLSAILCLSENRPGLQ